VAKGDRADDLTDRLIRELKLEGVKIEDVPAQPVGPGNRAPLPPTR
jgi:hypothetical protein